jgi:hypothetical protein
MLTVFAVFAVVAPLSSFCAAQEPNSQKKASAGKKKAASGGSLSGCLDQQEGHYILADDQGLSPIADLEADGFPTEGFAKHVGHKVTVRGTSTAGSTRPVFKVRTIETISETCSPTDKK